MPTLLEMQASVNKATSVSRHFNYKKILTTELLKKYGIQTFVDFALIIEFLKTQKPHANQRSECYELNQQGRVKLGPSLVGFLVHRYPFSESKSSTFSV
ncbi:hypothetical protein ABDK00_009435 [Niabella insulamsoli]|uniref:hypothetical protein n=1 Tax=Niabella insulamsoli TaxID=3144874 RepID=UPI0031FD6D6A